MRFGELAGERGAGEAGWGGGGGLLRVGEAVQEEEDRG